MDNIARNFGRNFVATSALLGIAFAASPLAAQSADSTLDRAVAAYATVKTARISFSQTIDNSLTGTTVTSQGELQQRRPSRFAVTFADPPGDRIVSDGQWVWVYLPSTNPGQVIRAKLGAEGAGATDFAAQFLEAPRKSYTVSGGSATSIDGSATHAVVLTPKSTSSPFSKVTLWVNDGDALLRRVETVDQSGVVRRITVTKFARNAPVDAKAFVFKVPAGVKVFDGPAS
ncbi:MAG TPA: outer membrane lipoprotein chaperone LolA [Gemmatimonadaceae bacterium]|nr:outer membrane lipoprotein chaperone LolA [Gemmatimonadaceae bacterium]